MIAGLLWMLGCGVGAAALALAGATAIAPYAIGAGVLGYFVSTIAAMIPQQVTLEVAVGEVAPSWRPAIHGATPELGSWVVAGIDAPLGLVLRIGALRIGGEGHDGAGYDIRGAATRTVDCHVGKVDFEAMCAALGIRKGALGPVVVPLVRSSQSTSGVLRMMAPWLATIGLVSVLGIIAGETGWLDTANGQLGLTIATAAIVVAGIVVMVLRGRRVRAPELELRVTPDALVLARPGGEPISATPWPAVLTERRRFTQSSRAGSYTMPLLILTVEGHEPLRLGAWDTRLAWPDGPDKAWRGPKWIAGAAVWPRLIEALREHHRL
ncbi:MAG: hypothetical protein ABI867_36535 [Kofleriaceae bacterium]